MSDVLPAWAEPFHGDEVVTTRRLLEPITREWAYGDGTGRGVRVAVVDSGIEADHPLVGPVTRAISVAVDRAAEGNVRFDEGPHDDLYGHGTACAGIIRSLAPEVEMISIRVLGENLRGSAFAFAHGLDWCIDNDVDVVNLSMSTANEDYLLDFHDLVDAAAYEGTLVVSAMNNERRTTIPSEFAGVFSVACGPGADRERIWRNPAAPAEWGAAGVDVEVPWSGGETVVATGNSFAAPVVAGHLARICGAHGGVTGWQARTILAELAENAEVTR